MNKKLIFIMTLICLCMAVGGIVWKIRSSHIVKSHQRMTYIQQQTALTPNSILLTIGSQNLTYGDLEREYDIQKHHMQIADRDTNRFEQEQPEDTEIGGISQFKYTLLSQMIERTLLYNAVMKDSDFTIEDSARFIQCLEETKSIIEKSPDFFASEKTKEHLRNRLCEKSIIDQYVQENLSNRIEIAEEDIESYYTEHKDEFTFPTRVEIRQIVLPTEKLAKKVRSRTLRSNFAKMAKKHSMGPEAKNGGKLGPFMKGQMPAVFDIAFKMRRGRISGIQKSEYGFHIILLENKIRGGTQSLNKARSTIVTVLREKKLREVYQEWLETELAATNIKSDYQIW